MKITASFPLTVSADGSVSLTAFNGGQELMEHLAQVVRDSGIPAGAEIRITVEPVRTRGRYAKWATLGQPKAAEVVA